MKLTSKDRQPITVIAETPMEVALCEIFLDGMDYARYYTLKKGRRIMAAKYTIIPEQERKPVTAKKVAIKVTHRRNVG